jgi:glycosyltransferase involved in cell wall biosynthesis
VGGNHYDAAYLKRLESLADKRVIFTGPVYGDDYWSLQKNAGVFVFAGEIGGIHPALVEAMTAGNAILYLDTPSNRETACDCGIAFHHEREDLATKLEGLLAAPECAEELRQQARSAARQIYDWEKVVDQYETLFAKLSDKPTKSKSTER